MAGKFAIIVTIKCKPGKGKDFMPIIMENAVAARRDCREPPIPALVRATANVRVPQLGPGAWYPRGGAWDPATFSVPPNANERTRGGPKGSGSIALQPVNCGTDWRSQLSSQRPAGN